MAGGLIQIASYGTQDLFLTGTPEITFFKVVYRRNTSFSMESMRVEFDDPTTFGGYSVVKLPKIGDLIHKTYLEIQLPEMNLFRETINADLIVDLRDAYNTALTNYQIVIDFMSPNRNAFVGAYQKYIPENNTENTTNDMIQAINDVFSQPGISIIVDNMKELVTTGVDNAPFSYDEISMASIASIFDPLSNKDDLFTALEHGIDKSIKTQKFFYDNLLEAKGALADAENENIKFAWVERIGHAIIDSIEIKIGGHKIDKHYGDWLNIWYELSSNRNLDTIYHEMIGNVPSLTKFDRVTKPTYLLKIPLQFWFCRFSGLSLPLISLEYHNVSIHVKFRKIEELSYIEAGTNIKINSIPGGIKLDEVPEELGNNISAHLMIDYIYLDNPERKRFAQSSHEYLIEQLQVLDKINVTQQKIQFVINNFVHPSKELIWVSQKDRYTKNPDGTIKCQWNNYSMNDLNKGNPIAFSSLDFHSYNRVPRLDGNYFNYLQPYETHRATPADGINMYSFSLFPEEQQPSGSANLSRIDRIVIYMEFSDKLFLNNKIIDPLVVRIYTRNMNILRFINGLSGLAWTYG